MTTTTLQTAQQRVVDARAALIELGVQRIDIESRAAKAELDRLANKGDQRAYKTATNRLRDAGEELERVGLLIVEAEAVLEDAVAAERVATLGVDEARLEADIVVLDVLRSECAGLLGEYIQALDELRKKSGDVSAELTRIGKTVPADERSAFQRKHDAKVRPAVDMQKLRPKLDYTDMGKLAVVSLLDDRNAADFAAGQRARRERAA